MSQTTTPTTLLQTLSSHLTISIHTILHARRVYPSTSFLKARAFDFPVAQSRHPKVCQWVNDAVGEVVGLVAKGGVEKVVVFLVAPVGWVRGLGDGVLRGGGGGSSGDGGQRDDGDGSSGDGGRGGDGDGDGSSEDAPLDEHGNRVDESSGEDRACAGVGTGTGEPQVLERFIWDISPLSTVFPVKPGEQDTPIVRRPHSTTPGAGNSPSNHSAATSNTSDTNPVTRSAHNQNPQPLHPTEPTHRNPPPTHHTQEETNNTDLHEQLRATLSALSSCHQKLKPLPEGCVPSIAVEMKDDAMQVEPPIGRARAWVPVGVGLQRVRGDGGDGGSGGGGTEGGEGGEGSDSGDRGGGDASAGKKKRGRDLGGASVLPLRAVDAGEFVFEMWVEEGAAK
ncbi:MAG: hypothetical protein M1831_001607 [Alyxoria varia]|nr:MAG: hypothetical protein M1831_001607 [Alyxoria varia]